MSIFKKTYKHVNLNNKKYMIDKTQGHILSMVQSYTSRYNHIKKKVSGKGVIAPNVQAEEWPSFLGWYYLTRQPPIWHWVTYFYPLMLVAHYQDAGVFISAMLPLADRYRPTGG